MKRTVIAALAVFCIFAFAACSKTRPTKQESVMRLKAKMYDVDRKIHKLENSLAQKPAKTKKQRAKIAAMKKKLEPSKQDLDALQARVDGLENVTAQSWDAFTASLEAGMDRLSNGVENMMGVYQEKQREETQAQ